jgi:hypothetical protein
MFAADSRNYRRVLVSTYEILERYDVLSVEIPGVAG